MARRKVSTLLDDQLFRRAKLEAVRQGRQVSEILGDALERYLASSASDRVAAGVAAGSWGALKLDRRRVAAILRDEDELFDA